MTYSDFLLCLCQRTPSSTGASATGGEPLRWRASTAGGYPDLGIWRPGFPTEASGVEELWHGSVLLYASAVKK
ncbi:MAG: hypothetical protein ACREPR_21555 [Brasilonema sp.]